MSNSFYLFTSQIILSTGPCDRLLEYDGITSNRLVLREHTGKLILSCKNVPTLKEKICGLGNSITIIKNLDEYQYLICKYIPNLSNKSIFKFKFQKIRLLIFLFIHKFTKTLVQKNHQISDILDRLNKSGNNILKETSELIQVYREASNTKGFDIDKSKDIESQINLNNDHFVYFDHTESEINKILFRIYSLDPDKVGLRKHHDYDKDKYDDEDDYQMDRNEYTIY